MRLSKINSWSTEKISQRVFYVLIGLAVVIFGLFFLVGYDMPFDENPDFNAPLFTDVLIILMWALLFLAIVLGFYSIVRSYRKTVRNEKVVNGIPENKIFRFTWLFTVVLLIVTFLVGSSVPMLINGNDCTDWLWLKLSDMFVYSSIVMLLAAMVAVCYGATRYIRKGKNHDNT